MKDDAIQETFKYKYKEYLKEYIDLCKRALIKGNSNCYECKYHSIVPGSSHHIYCSASIKSNLHIPQFDPHGVKNGWAFYPFDFDPIWMTTVCINFDKINN